jgi:hypothetical protein
LLSGWKTRFGCPQTITTDQGRQFESRLFHSLTSMCGIHLSRTTAFHPAANGLVERMHRSLKAAIMCREQERWNEAFPSSFSGCALSLRKTFRRPWLSSSTENHCIFQAKCWQHRPSPGIHRSSLPSSDATSSNYGQSQGHVRPPRLSLSTRTWQTLPTSFSGRVQYGAPWNRPTVALTRPWLA